MAYLSRFSIRCRRHRRQMNAVKFKLSTRKNKISQQLRDVCVDIKQRSATKKNDRATTSPRHTKQIHREDEENEKKRAIDLKLMPLLLLFNSLLLYAILSRSELIMNDQPQVYSHQFPHTQKMNPEWRANDSRKELTTTKTKNQVELNIPGDTCFSIVTHSIFRCMI